MPSGEILIAFLLATCVFAYMPGPALLYAAAALAQRIGGTSLIGLGLNVLLS